RGGKLVNVPDKAKAVMEKSGRGWSPAEWGLRWLWDQPGVMCVLSGMNSCEMIEENTRIASEADRDQLTEPDFAVLENVKAIIREKEKVGCTGCRYCMPCPKGVDIPGTFYYYNLMYMQGSKLSGQIEYAKNIGLGTEAHFATQCIGCGKCEQHCPQHLPIREKLKEADKALRPLPYRAATSVLRKIMHKG
ncbi:MAG: 4Fe-4S dicluster domain-containing protein, partial [Oscillospiraceae bacterium]|nr:4Fe-4S dicluster domain-containing protein [Oscillospiraceae bacterium]